VRDFKISLFFKAFLLMAIPLTGFAQDDEVEEKPTKETKKQEVIDQNTDQNSFDPEVVSRPGRLKKFGKKAYKLGDYYSTVNYLEKYNNAKPDKWKYIWMLAESYRRTRDYKNAEDMYGKIVATKAKKFPKAKFYLATMQKSNGFYEESERLLGDFKKEYKSGADAKKFKKLATSEMVGAQKAKAIIDSALKVIITPLSKSVNLPTMESTPIIVDDKTIIYGSIVADVAEYYSLAGEDRPERKLYMAKKTGPLEWKSTGELPGPFNKEGFNVASGSFSVDGLRFYFTRCPKNPTSKDNCAIWESKFKDGVWQEPIKLNAVVNDPEANSTHPAVGTYQDKKGKTSDVLFFVSDREKGGRGGLDLWYSVIDSKTGDFKKSKNLGSKINSAGDDITPFYDNENGILYFSSNGFPNIGGFDIFKAEGTYNKMGAPQNVGYPINSPADEAFFVLSKSMDEGYFVSNRLGGASEINPTCCDDIYNFRYTEFLRLGVSGNVFEMIKPEDVMNDTNGLDGVTVSIMKLDVEDPTDTVVLKTLENVGKKGYFFTLQYNNKYILRFEKDKYDTRYVQVSTTQMSYSDTVIENVGLKKTPPIEIRIPVIFFETNKANLGSEQKDELRSTLIPFMKENPTIKIKIKGNTDDIGNDRFNANLSNKRAEAVYRFMQEEGIEKERFELYGLGRSVPMYQPGDKGIDPEFARSRNRRVEFEIMGESRFKLIETGKPE